MSAIKTYSLDGLTHEKKRRAKELIYGDIELIYESPTGNYLIIQTQMYWEALIDHFRDVCNVSVNHSHAKEKADATTHGLQT